MSVTRLIYTSKYAVHHSDIKINMRPMTELMHILQSAKRNNSSKNVTGALIFDDASFAQLLEGDQFDVMYIFNKIKMDKRHTQINVIETATVSSRSFGNWWMGGLVRNATTQFLFEPFLIAGRFEPARLTAEQIFSLMISLTKAGVDRKLAPDIKTDLVIA